MFDIVKNNAVKIAIGAAVVLGMTAATYTYVKCKDKK